MSAICFPESGLCVVSMTHWKTTQRINPEVGCGKDPSIHFKRTADCLICCLWSIAQRDSSAVSALPTVDGGWHALRSEKQDRKTSTGAKQCDADECSNKTYFNHHRNICVCATFRVLSQLYLAVRPPPKPADQH